VSLVSLVVKVFQRAVPMPLKAIVFDFDGVIANSEPLHLRAFQDVLAERGISLTERDYYGRYLGFDDAGVFRKIAEEKAAGWADGDVDALVARKAVRIEDLERDVSLLFPGARELIQRAAAQVPLAIASGALGNEIRRILDRERLTRCFTAIVSANDTAAGKPSPEPYALAVARLSEASGAPIAAAECVAIEDSVWGLQSAQSAGLRTVAVTHTYPAEALSVADLIIQSLNELELDALNRICSGPRRI
jgi:HAD superfamily hydrolase (TIGR01509 family)